MFVNQGSTYTNFEELVNACGTFFIENRSQKNLEDIQRRRSSLSRYVESFHRDCGTMTPDVKDRIDALDRENHILIMTAHQPNLFSYSGVLRKATLCFLLAKKLEEKLKLPVINFFGIADQDFTDDRWVRVCQLPSVTSSTGTLELRMKLPQRLLLSRTPKPSLDIIKGWKEETEKWIDDTISSIDRMCKINFPELRPIHFGISAHTNNKLFWDIVEDCYARSQSNSDFNAFIMSKIVNDIWGYDTLFSRFSECQQAFIDEFSFLLSHYDEYSRSLRKGINMSHTDSEGGSVSNIEPELVPFWYHCECGSKARLYLIKLDGRFIGDGSCLGCGKHHELDLGTMQYPSLSDVASRISARSISMILVFCKGIMPSCYVGGIGGIKYLMKAQYIATMMGIPFPPLAFWRPHDRYLGLGQMEAILQLNRICIYLGAYNYSAAKDLLEQRISEVCIRIANIQKSKETAIEALKEHPFDKALKKEVSRILADETEIRKKSNLSSLYYDQVIIGKIPGVLNLIPSIIDYATSIGLRETSEQWIAFLLKNGNLSSDVTMESILNLDERIRQALSKGLLIGIDEFRLKTPIGVRKIEGGLD